LNECETWSLTLLEEYELRVSENRTLTGIVTPRREEVTGGCRTLHNAELHNLFSLPYVIKNIESSRMKWVGHVACMEEKRNSYHILVHVPEGI
jgi:hypothetical protein